MHGINWLYIYIIICFGVVLSFKVGQNENVYCRGDDSGTDKGIVHGWNFDRPWQFHHIPDRCMFASILSCNGGHHFYVSFTTGTRDLWPFWWCGSTVRGPSCVPWPKRKHFGVFRRMRFQVPRQKGHCWFLARGEHVQFPSSKLSYHIIILSAMIILRKSLNFITFLEKCSWGENLKNPINSDLHTIGIPCIDEFQFSVKNLDILMVFYNGGFHVHP